MTIEKVPPIPLSGAFWDNDREAEPGALSKRSRIGLFGIGLVDSPEAARRAAEHFLAQQVEAILLYIATYALSSTVLPVAQRTRVPIVVLNLQPVPAIAYERFNSLGDRGVMTGEWLAQCQACCGPEIANVFNVCGIVYILVTGCVEAFPG
jgi:L-arabinose isomerase